MSAKSLKKGSKAPKKVSKGQKKGSKGQKKAKETTKKHPVEVQHMSDSDAPSESLLDTPWSMQAGSDMEEREEPAKDLRPAKDPQLQPLRPLNQMLKMMRKKIVLHQGRSHVRTVDHGPGATID